MLSEISQTSQLDALVKKSPTPPASGDLVEGTVIAKDKMMVFVDLAPFGTGVIYGREYLNARDIIKKISSGDLISAKVVEVENPDGYIELSLKEARQALVWNEAEELAKTKRPLQLPVKDANKGGLIIEWQGLAGFLPASQLSAEHYPRVADGDKDKILQELKSLVGQKLTVYIITADEAEGKLIFSEKGDDQKEREALISHYKVGDVLEGEVTGAVDFGVFVRLEDGLEGLVHISEMDWGLVENPGAMYKSGQRVSVKVIDIKEGKISLSIKALKENPWLAAEQKYKKGERVSAVIIKYNKHGALASIEEGVAGLVHISEFPSELKMRQNLELGKSYPFEITLFEPKEQRMTLHFLGNGEPVASEG